IIERKDEVIGELKSEIKTVRELLRNACRKIEDQDKLIKLFEKPLPEIPSKPIFLDSIKKLLAENNEGEVINLMQQQSNIEIPESDEVYPLLEKSGLTRYQIYSKILDKLANNFIKKVETQNWDDAK
ncbi:15179_t:CDS:2, partial [Entrophospora sp. SA101]